MNARFYCIRMFYQGHFYIICPINARRFSLRHMKPFSKSLTAAILVINVFTHDLFVIYLFYFDLIWGGRMRILVFDSFPAPLQRSQSLSKDTGLGSTTNDTPMSCLEFIYTPTTEHTSGYISFYYTCRKHLEICVYNMIIFMGGLCF